MSERETVEDLKRVTLKLRAAFLRSRFTHPEIEFLAGVSRETQEAVFNSVDADWSAAAKIAPLLGLRLSMQLTSVDEAGYKEVLRAIRLGSIVEHDGVLYTLTKSGRTLRWKARSRGFSATCRRLKRAGESAPSRTPDRQVRSGVRTTRRGSWELP